MMRKVLRFTFYLLFTLGITNAGAQEKLVNIELTNGSIIHFTLDQNPVIKYSTIDVTVIYSDGNMEYKMSEIKRITIGDQSSAGIKTDGMGKVTGNMHYSNGTFIFEGFKKGCNIVIYDISGRQVKSYRVKPSGDLIIPTIEIPSGIYIIKANNITYKFIKK